MAKLILSISKAQPDIHVAPVSTDPLSTDYTAFNVYHTPSGELLNTFRAGDIVEQRRFMAALMGRGPGLFSQAHSGSEAEESLEANAISIGSAERASPSCQLLTHRQSVYNSMSLKANQNILKFLPNSFQEAIGNFPSEFYFPNLEVPVPSMPGDRLPVYSPSNTAAPSQSLPQQVTFRPPHGLPVNYPSIVGHGQEVGLEQGQMAVWDQENEFYYFIDFNNKTVFVQDPRAKPQHKPRTRKLQLSVQKGEGDLDLPPCEHAIVQAAAERASRRPHGCVLKAVGRKGLDGRNGPSGAHGKNGEDGEQGVGGAVNGRNGSDGMMGRDGRNGEGGDDGARGKNVIVELSGNASELSVGGTCLTVARLGREECEEVLLVDCRGGNGGDGGRGGEGGKGGHGGDGGQGAMGCNGGHGGDGGEGGRGANGGSGGNGGTGGSCLIQTADPRLLILVEANCLSGRAGRAGPGSTGGRGGSGGFGGEGGQGTVDTMRSNSETSPGQIYPGVQGKPGMTGANGESGLPGQPGLSHNSGRIQWAVTSPDGQVKHSSTMRYEAEVVSMEVSSSFSTGVIEPYQRVQVTNVAVQNSGGLPLPTGAQLSFPSTSTIQFEHTLYELPELQPGEVFRVPAVFCGRIMDEPSPNAPGPFSRSCKFSSQIKLLGRPFEKSFLEKTVTVEYPVKLVYALAKKDISQGEVTTLEVGIENVGSVAFGSSSSSGGSLQVQIHLDPSLVPLGLCPSSPVYSGNPAFSTTAKMSNEGEENPHSYTVNYDHTTSNSLYIHVNNIQPGSHLSIPISVQLRKETELQDTCLWQAELYLRGKLIEYSHSEMRVAPKYSSQTQSVQVADVLLIKTDSLYQEEMAFWQSIFDLLEVSFDYWDANYHKAGDDEVSSDTLDQPFPPFQSLYQGKLIIFPHCDLDQVPAEDIIAHFQEDSESSSAPASLESSMLLFLDSTCPDRLMEHVQEKRCHKKVLRHLCCNVKRVAIPQEDYSGCHLLSPGTVLSPEYTIKRAQKYIIKKQEQQSSSQAVVMMGQSNIIRRQGSMMYSYGKLDVRKCPLPRSSNFQCIDSSARQMVNMGLDDPFLTFTSRKVPLASNFGQVLLATLAGLPLHCKLAMLRQPVDRSSPLFAEFHLPNGSVLTKPELAAVCLAKEIIDETLSVSCSFSRLQALLSDIKQHCSTAVPSRALLVSQLLDLVRREGTNLRLAYPSSTIVAQQTKELLAICNSAPQLFSVPSDLLPLPCLSQLQSQVSILRPQQLTSDELYDITC